MALTSSPVDFSNGCTGTLAAAITTTTATGFTVTADSFVTPAGTGANTWPTGPQVWKISRKTRTNVQVEYVGVETSSQTGTAITTGAVNRYLPANGSSLTSQGNGLAFPAGSIVELVWHAYAAEKVAYKDVANTFTTTQTITAPLLITGTSSYSGVPSMTTAQRTALTPSQPGFVYDTDLSQVYKYEGGAWAAVATGSFSNAANGTAGKVDLATAAEIAAATALDASSGASNALRVANTAVNAASANWASGGIPALNTAKFVDGSLGGTGVASPVLGALLIGGGAGLAMTPIGPGTTNQIPVSNGTTLAMGAVPSYGVPTLFFADTAGVGTSSTATVDVPTHQITIPSNDLINNVGYEFHWAGTITWAAGTVNARVQLGTTAICSLTCIPNATTDFFVKGIILGTAAAGASVAVRGTAFYKINNAATYVAAESNDYGTANVATNGALILKLNIDYTSSNSGNSFVSSMCKFRKISTTAF